MKFFKFFSLLLVVLFSACNIDNPVKECDDYTKDAPKVSLDISINETIHKIDAKLYEGEYPPGDFEYSLLISAADKQILEALKRLSSSPANKVDNIHVGTIYFENNISSLNRFALENIIAYSIYESKNNHLFHRLYLKDQVSKEFKELKELSCWAVASSSYSLSILVNVLQIKEMGSCLMIFNSELPEEYSSLSRDKNILGRRLEKYFLQSDTSFNASQRNDDSPTNSVYCINPCRDEPIPNYVCVPDHPMHGHAICEPNTGGSCRIAELYDEYDRDETIKNNNLNLYHRFETDFLLSYNFGIDYSSYYYTLVTEIDLLQVDVDLALKIFTFFDEINDSVSYVVNSDEDLYNSSFVPVSTSLKVKAISIINDFKEVTDSSELLNVLDIVASDFIKYENKTLAYIMNDYDCC